MQALNILVTRPAHQAEPLMRALQQAGYHAHLLPALEIIPLVDQTALQQLIARLEQYDYIIFTSANAVNHSASVLYQSGSVFPEHIKIIAIGNGTQRSLQQQRIRVDIMPAQANSEGLLDLAEMQQVKNKKIAIIKGEGGRELLANGLTARGATISEIAVYQRRQPNTDAAAITQTCLNWQIDVVIITSTDSLRNFYKMLDAHGKAWLQQVILLLISDRIVATVKELGLQSRIIIAENTSETAIINALARGNEHGK